MRAAAAVSPVYMVNAIAAPLKHSLVNTWNTAGRPAPPTSGSALTPIPAALGHDVPGLLEALGRGDVALAVEVAALAVARTVDGMQDLAGDAHGLVDHRLVGVLIEVGVALDGGEVGVDVELIEQDELDVLEVDGELGRGHAPLLTLRRGDLSTLQ